MNNEYLNDLLEELVVDLKVSTSMYDKATQRFNSITEHLKRKDSLLREYHHINLYPQGSFNLGTAIKPFGKKEHYDVDVVCEISASKKAITQEKLKRLVGYEVEKYQRANNFQKAPEENRRCWTLLYSDTEQFHMDILPAIPDVEGFRKILNGSELPQQWLNSAIAITDRQHAEYSSLTDEWYVSNPKGYAEWFRSIIDNRIKYLAETQETAVEHIPTYYANTNLQKAIQILKRHRDIMFQDNQEDKPISIIITTLAAMYYRKDNYLLKTLVDIIDDMAKLVNQNPDGLKILNPVNPKENFADKWSKYPKRKVAFQKWVWKLKQDFDRASKIGNTEIIENYFYSAKVEIIARFRGLSTA
ncbi:MAG: nucleotidyltransferase [Candidatus Cloacimonetes bacterium]|nr:nucleotidyltransferase [Candidatus Cloacimonadota bacterium]